MQISSPLPFFLGFVAACFAEFINSFSGKSIIFSIRSGVFQCKTRRFVYLNLRPLPLGLRIVQL